MRHLYLFVTALSALTCTAVFAQVPNAGFETWTNSTTPDSWFGVNVSQSSTAHTGSFSAQGTATPFLPGTPAVAPLLISITNNLGFPVSQRYMELRGYYQFASVNSDAFRVIIALSHLGIGVGGGAGTFSAAATWTQFPVRIVYSTADVPDTAIITITIVNPSGVNTGSTFLVDDLSLSTSTDVANRTSETPVSYALEQNYPNPFNPSTMIRFSLPAEQVVTLEVYNILGQKVATLLDHDRKDAGTYEVPFAMNNQASGIYVYRLQAGTFVQSKTMTLVK